MLESSAVSRQGARSAADAKVCVYSNICCTVCSGSAQPPCPNASCVLDGGYFSVVFTLALCGRRALVLTTPGQVLSAAAAARNISSATECYLTQGEIITSARRYCNQTSLFVGLFVCSLVTLVVVSRKVYTSPIFHEIWRRFSVAYMRQTGA